VIYLRDAAGRWRPFRLPHGLCLGGGMPTSWPSDPGLALVAYLRAVANRVASAGRFHEAD
jgi:hypothetical protein